ncbi:MAG: chitobiase/beta-hexosaminidase C-terminal domain-containing protein [Butyrivibrio sp.]|nr:FN3 associated domain-containing protein [Butyrivibrio sp.]MBR1642600.1 chitobiase/beta-hexosaminidase C-terminal domain-containing protein [Butyrivibrio sp.]
MKCPNCGLEIPEGHMYCDRCGLEINFVPDFEPEVENEINATLSGMADELNKEDRKKEEKKKKREKLIRSITSKWQVILVSVVAVALLICAGFYFFAFNNKSSLYYLSIAESEKTSGSIEDAIKVLEQGHADHPNNTDIIFRMSDYYLEDGRTDEAVETLKLITDGSIFSDEKILSAYESIISIYRQSGEYDKIAEALSGSDNSAVNELRKKFVPAMPVMSPASGTYTEVNVNIKLLEGTSNKIYYTVNDGEPDSGSILYDNEIVLDDDGTYNIKAVAINEYGISSPVSEGEYIVEKGAPAEPEIMEPSGDYNQNTMIVAVAEAGTSIFYTTDGSDPTMESKQYVSPITMPVGSSHFRFIAYDNDGNCSEIVDRQYHLVYTRLVSTEQAVNNLVSTLVRLGYLLDNSGKVIGIEGHNEYIYNSVIEIQGAGEYYVVVENHVSNDGSVAPTGLMYAVNTHDGAVNRLGYDSSGKYTLITISNR